jgi:hypothetical protein
LLSGKNTESRIMDAGNLLLVSENLHRLSKKERANANAYDINEFIEPYVSSFRLCFYITCICVELICHHASRLQTPIETRF